MNTSTRAVVALLVVVPLGCASSHWKPLDAAALQNQRAHTIGVVATTPSNFDVGMGFMTVAVPFVPLVGLAPLVTGVAAGYRKGARIAAENHLADPSLEVASRLSAALAGKYALVQKTPKQLPVDDDDQESYIVHWDTDLILQVTTKTWSMDAFPDNWNRYRIAYEARLELRDQRTRRVVASGDCQAPVPENPKGAPTSDEMVDRDAWLLKYKLREAAQYCAQKYARELFFFRLPEDKTSEAAAPKPAPDPRVIHASCHLEGTPEWKAADPTEKREMLQECWDHRIESPPPVPPPAAPAQTAPP
jgi:hypothetical protein